MTVSEATPGGAGSGRSRTAALTEPEAVRRLGVIALGALLGGVPAPGGAATSDVVPASGVGQLRLRQATLREPSPATSPTAPVAAALAGPVPAVTLTVTTAADLVDPKDGRLSLREAVAKANASPAADAIGFAAALAGTTLVLTGGELVLSRSTVIDGAGRGITLSGGGTQRILRITGGGTQVALKNLTLTGGHVKDRDGGAILLESGSLSIGGSTISDSRAEGPAFSAPGSGGGIFARSGALLLVSDSRFLRNGVTYNGGAIATGAGVVLSVRNSELSGNFTSRFIGGAIFVDGNASLNVDGSILADNGAGEYGACGAISVGRGNAVVSRSSIIGNGAGLIGGICADGALSISDSTLAGNSTFYADRGNISADRLVVRNSTITGNEYDHSDDYEYCGAALYGRIVEIHNSIVVGNGDISHYRCHNGDVTAAKSLISNGHNIFGSAVAGSIAGDRQGISPATVFAAIDPYTGGGKLSPKGIVPLRNATTNPALSAADPITAGRFGQLGTTPRPQPAGSLPDIGAIEIKQALSTGPTVNNDVITGSAAANNLAGLAGNDLLLGLAGADTLNGNDGSDVLDGGPGNDVLNGGTGMDIATFAGSTAVTVDLTAKPATARRGSETDRLTSIEGAIGSDKADIFKGDGQNNEFQGGLGKDTATGGGGRDLHAFRAAQDSPPGAGRDIVKDFTPGQDVLDVGNLDADSTTPGQQSFRWVGKAVLTGAAQLGYYVAGGSTIVRASTDADAQPELEIQLTGTKTLTAGDFRF